MDKQEPIKRLFGLGWSNRKINRATGIHRDTISIYRKDWKQAQRVSSSDNNDRSRSAPTTNEAKDLSQNAPLDGDSKCPLTLAWSY